VRSKRTTGEPPEREAWVHLTGLLLGTQLLFVLVASRLAGVRSPLGRTIVVLGISIIAAIVLLVRRLPQRQEAIVALGPSDTRTAAS